MEREFYDKKYYQKHKERLTENQRKYRSRPEVRARYLAKAKRRSIDWYANPENKIRRKNYNQALWLRHIKELEDKVGRARPERCEICNRKDTICFDHCHKLGHFRGWICKRCNTVLGKVEDDKELLQKLIDYLNVSNK